MEIQVFSGETAGGGSAAGGAATNRFHISCKWYRDNRIMLLTADRQIDLDSVFPAFMRYRRHRNGTTSSDRDVLDKWFAFQYQNSSHEETGSTAYKDTSMLTLADVNDDHPSPTEGTYNYIVRGRDSQGHSVGFDEAIAWQFFGFESFGEWRTCLNGRGWKVVADAGDYCGYNNCGIALVDRNGTPLSNIVRLKIVARVKKLGIGNEILEDISSDPDPESLAALLLFYPMKDK